MKKVIGNATLYLGDCLEILPTLEKVDAVITDPPYGVMLGEVKTGESKRKNQQSYSTFNDTPEYIKNVCVPAVKISIKKAQRVLVTTGNRNMFEYPQPDDMGIWWNPAATSRGKWGFMCAQTPIFYYGKDPHISKGCTPNSPTGNHRGRNEDIDHPCPKPIGIMEWLVNKGSVKGEIVVDPFMGSGTTGVACMNLGRKFIGIEIEDRYFQIACERIDAAQRQGKLFEEADQSINTKTSLLPGM